MYDLNGSVLLEAVFLGDVSGGVKGLFSRRSPRMWFGLKFRFWESRSHGLALMHLMPQFGSWVMQ